MSGTSYSKIVSVKIKLGMCLTGLFGITALSLSLSPRESETLSFENVDHTYIMYHKPCASHFGDTESTKERIDLNMIIDPTSPAWFKSQLDQVSSKIVGSMPLLRWYAWCEWRCAAPAAQPTTGVATAPKEWETVSANPKVYGRDQQTCHQNHGILSFKVFLSWHKR